MILALPGSRTQVPTGPGPVDLTPSSGSLQSTSFRWMVLYHSVFPSEFGAQVIHGRLKGWIQPVHWVCMIHLHALSANFKVSCKVGTFEHFKCKKKIQILSFSWKTQKRASTRCLFLYVPTRGAEHRGKTCCAVGHSPHPALLSYLQPAALSVWPACSHLSLPALDWGSWEANSKPPWGKMLKSPYERGEGKEETYWEKAIDISE